VNIPQHQWARLLGEEPEEDADYADHAEPLHKTHEAYVRKHRRKARYGRLRGGILDTLWIMAHVYGFILLGAFTAAPFIYAVIVEDPWWALGLLVTLPVAVAVGIIWSDW